MTRVTTETFSDICGDVFDIRDVIKRFETLEKANDEVDEDAADERAAILAFFDEVRGRGGDEQWLGDWYPVTFIADFYFVDYAEQLADDIGAIDRNATWPCNCIDWAKAAEDLRQDYISVDINGTTYWYR